MTCGNCPNQNGFYSHCTCYLHGEHGVDPANGSMMARDWYNACNLTSPPANSTYYLICSQGHCAIRDGNTYYYHPGSNGVSHKTKAHSNNFNASWVGCTGTVKYMDLN